MTTLKRFNQDTGEWEYVLSGPKGDTGATGAKGDKGDPGGWVSSSAYTGNLNAQTTPGLYLISWATASNAANNAPVNVEGHLEVVKYGTTYTMQRYTVAGIGSHYYGHTFSRVTGNNGANWSAWSDAGTDSHRAVSWSTTVTNANDVAAPGVYQVSSAAGTTANNFPISAFGVLEVYSNGGTVRFQTFRAGNANHNAKTFSRSSADSGATWTPWYEAGDAAVTAHVAAADPHTQYARKSASNTFTGETTFTTDGIQQMFWHPANGADAKRWAQYVGTDGSIALFPQTDVGNTVGNSGITLFRSGGIAFRNGGVIHTAGTGSPENVIAAPIGSRYVDTAATNGAVEWVKAAGAGSTGWKVVYGDTGWRNLSYPSGWEGASSAPYCQIRRNANTVTLRVRAKVAAGAPFIGSPRTNTTFLSLPSGFGSEMYATLGVAALSSYTPNISIGTQGNLNNLDLQGLTGTWAEGDYLHIGITFPTFAAWPTTLPGTA